jgi:hypothetical protein
MFFEGRIMFWMKRALFTGIACVFAMSALALFACRAPKEDDQMAAEVARLQEIIEQKDNEIELLKKILIEEDPGDELDEEEEQWYSDTETLAIGSGPSFFDSAPAGLKETVLISTDDWFNGKVTYEIELLELVSGTDAFDMIIDANIYNKVPPKGKEYVLAKFRIKLIVAQKGTFAISHERFEAVGEDGTAYTTFASVCGLEPELVAQIHEGEECYGWTYFLVDKTDDPVAVINRERDGETRFDLRAK